MKDEQGPRWDEVTIDSSPEKMRKITTYNFKGFPLSFLANNQYVFVRQLYSTLDSGSTKLTFQTEVPDSANIFAKLIFYMSKAETKDIFEKNLKNIKAAIEGRPREFPWR